MLKPWAVCTVPGKINAVSNSTYITNLLWMSVILGYIPLELTLHVRSFELLKSKTAVFRLNLSRFIIWDVWVKPCSWKCSAVFCTVYRVDFIEKVSTFSSLIRAFLVIGMRSPNVLLCEFIYIWALYGPRGLTRNALHKNNLKQMFRNCISTVQYNLDLYASYLHLQKKKHFVFSYNRKHELNILFTSVMCG